MDKLNRAIDYIECNLDGKISFQHLARLAGSNQDTFVRYAEAEQLISGQLAGVNGNSEFQFTDIWPILRKSHYVYDKETIWSLALELSSGRYNLYYDTTIGQQQ